MNLNLKNPLVFFDLETTGTNITTDRIIELAYVKVFPNGKTEEKDISTLIENVNNAVVGISKIANKGTTIFLQDGASNLGLGTGFIVSKDGYIVTNQHVSGEKNSTCYVTLENGKNYKASVVWSDTDLDLSIIKINVNNLEYLDLGDSDKIKVAEQVYAIGNPIGFEFQRTVTSGIISGLNRTIKIEEDNKTSYMEDLIQTDATINPGNSGGPLININGEVLGINSVKITSAEGIGFAIPINIIKPIIEKLTNTGEYITPSLGVFAYDKNIVPYINQELDQNIKLDKGIYIADVTKNSPAEKVGVKREAHMYSKCQKCGKKLTDPESIKRGYGPECWNGLTTHYYPHPEDWEKHKIPGQMTIEDFLGDLKDGGEKDMS